MGFGAAGRGCSTVERMSDWTTFATIIRDWTLPLVAAIIGAMAGGYATLRVARTESRQARRERYGKASLDALGSVRVAVQAARTRAFRAAQLNEWGQAADGPEDISAPLALPREARDIWVNSQLAAMLKRDREARLAISRRSFHHHESLLEKVPTGSRISTGWTTNSSSARSLRPSPAASIRPSRPLYRDGPEYRCECWRAGLSAGRRTPRRTGVSSG